MRRMAPIDFIAPRLYSKSEELRSEDANRIHTRGTVGGQGARCESDDGQAQDHSRDHPGIEWADSVHLVFKNGSQTDSAGKTEHEAADDKQHSFAKHEFEDAARAAAQSDAD